MTIISLFKNKQNLIFWFQKFFLHSLWFIFSFHFQHVFFQHIIFGESFVLHLFTYNFLTQSQKKNNSCKLYVLSS